MYIIRGILRLTAPLHIAAPKKETVDSDTDQLLPGGEKGIMVVPATKYRLPTFPRANQVTASGLEEDDGHLLRGPAFADVPVIPANDLRGRLRRCAACQVFDVLLARKEQLSLDAYHGMTCGAVTGSPAGRLTFAEAGQATQHPFLGLFGGGPKMVRSAVQGSTGWPILASTIQAGVISEDFQEEVPCPPGSEWLRKNSSTAPVSRAVPRPRARSSTTSKPSTTVSDSTAPSVTYHLWNLKSRTT